MGRTQSRRDFMRTLATGAAATLASGELFGARAQSPKWVGIQIGPHSLYDEGIGALPRSVAGVRGRQYPSGL